MLGVKLCYFMVKVVFFGFVLVVLIVQVEISVVFDVGCWCVFFVYEIDEMGCELVLWICVGVGVCVVNVFDVQCDDLVVEVF